MTARPGSVTGEFGAWLSALLQGTDFPNRYTVYFDHGNKEKFPNVAAIKGFLGDQVANRNRFADIDVMVVNNQDGVVLLIEIEETTISPKKLLGDVFSILFCNCVAVRVSSEQKKYRINPKTRLIIAGIVPSEGSGLEKINGIILPRLQQFVVPQDAILVKNVSFVAGDSILDLMDKLKQEVKNLLAL